MSAQLHSLAVDRPLVVSIRFGPLILRSGLCQEPIGLLTLLDLVNP